MSASRQVALGVFLVVGLLLFGFGLFWIGDRRQLFEESIELNAEFTNISGLARGAKVRVSGLDAGEVLEIRIPPNPDSRFRVRFRAVSDFLTILRMDSIASIQNDGLVGNKFLQVEGGRLCFRRSFRPDTLSFFSRPGRRKDRVDCAPCKGPGW